MLNSRVSPRRRRRARMTASAGITLVGIGSAVLAAGLTAPQSVGHAYGTIKTTIVGGVSAAREEVFGDLPTVDLGATRGVDELNRCDGTFTEMRPYGHKHVPPVWAGDNNCLGDVLLSWEIGQHMRVTGSGRIG